MSWGHLSDAEIDARNQDALISLDVLKMSGPELAEISGTILCSVIGCTSQAAVGDLCEDHHDAIEHGPFEARS